MALKHQERIRLLLGDEIAMGPGKADLLEAIASSGSISAAARQLAMSYRRAWLLVETMNACFAEALVSAVTGGSGGGGAVLTETGRDVLARYRQLEASVARVIDPQIDGFESLLRKPRTTRRSKR